MKKRITAIILTMIFVVSMTCLSFATITPHLSINIDPTDASYTLTATAEGAGEAPAYQWYACGPNGEDPVAVEGATSNVYEPIVAMETKYFYCEISNGTESARTEVASISDTSASKKKEENTVATATEGNVVSTFSVAGIEPPVAGEIPDQTGEIVTENDSPGYYILSVRWDTELPTFIPETAYTATVLVNLSDGYQAADTIACYINNNPATVIGDPATGSFAFYYTFPSTAVEKKETSSNPLVALWNTVKEKITKLPAPLGIPAWIWGLAVLILLIALISAVTAHSRARKYERSGQDYLDELYEETMRRRQAAREEFEEEYDDEYEEDDFEDEEYEDEEEEPAEEAPAEEAPAEAAEEAPEADGEEAPEGSSEEDPEDGSGDEPIESIYGK